MPAAEISGETAAWIAASGAALGALIGATAGGLVDVVVGRAREKRDAKIGARLVRLDLSLAARQLKAAEDEGKWWVFFNTKMEAWATYRAALASRLGEDRFDVITQSVAELERFGVDMAQAPLEAGATFRDVTASRDSILTMRRNATAAYDALAKLARGKASAGLLHD